MSMLVPGGLTDWVPMQVGATATGNGEVITSGGEQGAFTVLDIQVSGISGDTITFEATVDGTNWVAIQATNLNDGSDATTATANGLYRIVIGGLRSVRARISTYSAGTIYVTGSAAA